MPELPEVETVCRGLALRLTGQRLVHVEVRRADLRLPMPADFAARLTGRRVERIGRRAKYILIHLDDGAVVIGHLGMSGRLCVLPEDAPPGAPGTHDHVAFRTEDGVRVVYTDPRRFGLLTLTVTAQLGEHPLLKELGPEPLDAAFTAAVLQARLRGRRVPLKAALLDQGVVAGLGNIYVCEALYRARLSPNRQAGTVTDAQAKRLVAAIKQVLSAAIEAGGSTLRDYVQADGELGFFQNQFAVYGRAGEPCRTPGCRGVIERQVQAGRSTYACPVCQK